MSDPARNTRTGTAQIALPIAELLRRPNGPRDRQLLFGETVRVLENDTSWCRVQADKDGYTGFVPATSLVPLQQATHWISAPSTHSYQAPDIKSSDLMALSFGSLITVLSLADSFAKTPHGYIPLAHLTPLGTHLNDLLEVAEKFLGTPYLWGGNSRFGIDCSGLVQAAFLACGHPCPGDSSQQEQAFGPALPPQTAPQRGDLLFWKGHVALVQDPDTILHANAYHMAVRYEALGPALERIERQGDGPITSHLRP